MESLASRIDVMDHNALHRMLTTLQTLLVKTQERITTLKEPSTNCSPLVDASLFQFHRQALNNNLEQRVLKHLKSKHLKYKAHPKNKNSPQLLLFGSHRYGFSVLSATLEPIDVDSDAIMKELLDAVNAKEGTNYNSMLVNKYRDFKVALGPHKDDEKCLNPSSPISTLSLGATRKFSIFLNDNKQLPAETLTLVPGSLFTMLPGFQEKYWHAVEAGDKNSQFERGVRYSVTFRCILPPTPAAVSVPTLSAVPVTKDDDKAAPVSEEHVATPATEHITNQQASNIHDTFVFGSSLVKGLDDKILSKYTKNFKVFTNSGACIGDIYEDIERIRDCGKYVLTNITNVFLICGGNDVENAKSDEDIKCVYEDFWDIMYLAKLVFPNAKINFVSLIPRRAKYDSHIRNMHKVNLWLKGFASYVNDESIRYVDIFSFFLLKTSSAWTLNNKLFNGSKLHFSAIGDSVLAKVLIGVANRPR